jgi:hypothetical protein
MYQLTIEAWLAVAGVIFACTAGGLYVLASIVRDAARRIELYKQVHELRLEYARRIRELQAKGHTVAGAPPLNELEGAPDLAGTLRRAA